MRRFALWLAVVATACLLVPAAAQQPEQPRKIKTLVDYKQELGLSDQQIQDVVATLNQFKTELEAYQQKLVAAEKDFQKLLEQHADLEAIKAKLRESADLRFQIRYLDVVTSRKVEAILSPEQMSKWREIQKKNQAEQAASGDKSK
ncbi:MAG: hypothetical protein AB1758_30585 [Candidatus Eremiobacterota bacterium]